MVMYRKDLFEKAGLTMPDAPDLGFQSADAARKITDKGNEISTVSACAARPAGARTWLS